MKVLLTGGSGFMGSHILKCLLDHEHSVVTTVRSVAKGEKVIKAFPQISSSSQLSYAVVEDIAVDGAFDQVLKSEHSFDAVIHNASPFHFNFSNPSELLDPAIKGTTNILKAIKAHGPNVKRVVVTSSFAAITTPDNHPAVYDESKWNDVTYEEGMADRAKTYRASKTLAERAAWAFMEEEKPDFTLSTICPPIVYGPLIPGLADINSVNTSNTYFLSLIRGGWKEKLPPTGTWIWVDVRDVALAHVRAIEVPEAAGKRFFITAGHYDMADVATIAKEHFPDIQVPDHYASDRPNPLYGYDNSRSKDILGIDYVPLEKSVVDTIDSLRVLGA